jgi:hypothetical protein
MKSAGPEPRIRSLAHSYTSKDCYDHDMCHANIEHVQALLQSCLLLA